MRLGDPDGSTQDQFTVLRWEGYELKPNQGYAVLVWPPEDQWYSGKEGLELRLASRDPCLFLDKSEETTLVMDHVSPPWATPQYNLWNWTVVIVEATDRGCQVVSEQPPPHRFYWRR